MGAYEFKLVLQNKSSPNQLLYSFFTVTIVDNPCIGAWSGVPAIDDLSQQYTAGSGALVIELTGLTCGECEFTVSVFEDQDGQAIDFVTANQAITSQLPTATDSRVI